MYKIPEISVFKLKIYFKAFFVFQEKIGENNFFTKSETKQKGTDRCISSKNKLQVGIISILF